MNKSLLLLLLILGGISIANCSGKNTNTYIDQGLQAKEFFYNIPNTPKSFQLFSHGRAGELLIKGKWLTTPQVAVWLKKSKLLKEATHLNIYACEFGKGEKAVAYLEKSLSITIAASNNITGASGDWSLETGTGKDVLQFPAYPYSLQNEFITTWEVTAGDLDITIPTNKQSYTYNYTVDWGDGTKSTNQTGHATHTYASPGVYTVKISGTFPAICFWYGNDKDKIKSIEQWGNIEWFSMKNAFYGCSNLTIKDGIAPPNLSQVKSLFFMFCKAVKVNMDVSLWDVSNITNMSYMFSYAYSFQGTGLTNWDVSNVIDMTHMFSYADSFDADLSGWNVSSVTDMNHIFYYADVFQGKGLANWDVRSVTNMRGMFSGTKKFNSDLSAWNVGNVTNMRRMFISAGKFNSDLSKWDVSKVTDMYRMFYYAEEFESDLSAWDVGNVTNMRQMFSEVKNFDSDLSAWDVSNVTDISSMFAWAVLFQGKGLINWDVSKVTDMSGMFIKAGNFNSDLSKWDVSKVTDMSYMFYEADQFESDLSTWNVSNVTDMNGMFGYALSFLGVGLNNWDISKVSDMGNMFYSVTLPPDTYTTILNSWATLPIKNNVSFHGGKSKYCDDSGRNVLLSKGWRIRDGGKIASITIDLGADINNCPGTAVTLDAGNHSGVIYLWNTGETSQTISVNTLGAFSVEVSSTSGCVARDTILVKDNLPPVAPGLSDVTGECSATAIVPTTTDNCSGTITGTTTDPLTYTTQGTHVINWTFDDGNGNSITVPQNVIVKDIIAPVAPTLADVVGECSVTVVPPTTTDNCSGTITGTTTAPLTYTNQGNYVINWIFDDGNGNKITVPQSVIIDDVTSPDVPVLSDLTEDCGFTATAPTTIDNCSGTIAGTTTDPITFNAEGNYVISWIFDDGNRNSITVPQNVIIDDTTNPVRPTLADVVGECSVTAVVPTTTDNCSGTITGTTTDPLTYTTQGTHVINWTFDDGNGNSITVPQNVIVEDVIAPVRPTLTDVVGECTATVVIPTTTDNCSGTITGTTTDLLTYFTQGTHVINWIFDDGNGNIITVAQNVMIDDVTDPDVPVLSDLTEECGFIAIAPTTTDNCSGTITGTTTDPLTYTTQGTHVINWIFDDGNGNVITVAQNVIIDDVTDPVRPTLADVIGECSATAVTPTTTDNCSGTIVGATSDPLTYTTQGTHIINWTFDDGNGNSITVAQNVIVDDVTDPVRPTLADVIGECSATAVVPTTSDNCSGTITGITSDPLSYTTQGTHTINWIFDDGNGNIITVAQNVIVDDVTDPDVPILSDLTGECGFTAVAPTTTDNCSGTITGTTSDPLSYNIQGTYVINWTFDDGNGNSITVAQNVIIDDVTNPVAPTLADVVGECSATVAVPTTSDNCSGTITGIASDPLSYTTQGTHTINWIFDDGNGNIITVPQNVIVDDVTDPVRPTLADVVGECTATVVIPTTTDNCSGTITGTTTDPLIYTTQGTHVINWTFDDGNGNSITVPQNVIVDDVTAPVRPTLADVLGECTATAVAPITSDNCSGTVTGTTTDPLTYTTQGTYIINWIFNDGNGNVITVPQNVIIDDVIVPIPPILDDASGMCTVSLSVPTASDACMGEIQGTTSDPLTYDTEGSYVVNWIFDDGNGNISGATQNVDVFTIVEDVELSSSATELTCDVNKIDLTTDAKVQGKALYKWFKDGDLIHGETSFVLEVGNGKEGEYAVEVSDENLHCNVLSNPVLITENVTAPTVCLSPLSGSLTTAETIVITATGTSRGNASYLWTTGETTSAIEVKLPGKYSVEVTDSANGCRVNSSDTGQEAIITNYWKDNIPKAFTPNADGYNDSWDIKRIELARNLKIVIYNRWGKALYKFSGTGNEYKGTPWKGVDGNTNLPIGSYYYAIEIDDKKPILGTVTIRR